MRLGPGCGPDARSACSQELSGEDSVVLQQSEVVGTPCRGRAAGSRRGSPGSC